MTQEQGRSVLATGGNRGTGLATARYRARRGGMAAAIFRAAPPPCVDFLRVRRDVTGTAGIDRAFEEVEEAHADVEVLVANKGVVDAPLLVRMSQEGSTSVLDTHLTGARRVARHGRTVILVSGAAGMRGETGQAKPCRGRAGRSGPLPGP